KPPPTTTANRHRPLFPATGDHPN
ncbi:hypothetical protein CCACVL1_17330, partial [Corchorus capsularis]